MSKFIVSSAETVYYETEVEAKNAEQAKQMILSGQVDVGSAQDSSDFSILEVEVVI